MTCSEWKQWLTTYRAFAPAEGDALTSDALAHSASCPPCQEQFAHQTQCDETIRTAMQQVVLPVHGQDQVFWKLQQQRRQHSRSKALYWSVAAAAALLLAVSVNWYLQRPYDLHHLQDAVAAIDQGRVLASYDVAQHPRSTDLQQWLSRHGIAITVPARLKLHLLSNAYVIDSGGRKVAVLEMRLGTTTSRICLLQRRFFSEAQQRKLFEQDHFMSFVVADQQDAESLGWMIVDQGSAHLFVDGLQPHDGI